MEQTAVLLELNARGHRQLAAELQRLRWSAVVVPVAFILLLDLVRASVLPGFWQTPPGFAVSLLITAGAAAAFALTVFREIARFQARAAKRAAQVEALNRIAAAASEDLDLATTIGRGLDQIVAATGADASLVCRLHADEAEHSAVGGRGFSPEFLQRIQHAKLAEDRIASEVVATRQSVRFGDVLEDPDVRQISGRDGIRSGISVPLMSADEVNGIVVVAFRSEHRFDDDDYEFLNGVGRQLGMAIHNAQLYEESVTRNRELSALLEVQAAVSSSLELGEILARSLETVTRLTTADAAEVWVPDGDDLILHRCEQPADEPLLGETRCPRHQGLLGRAVSGVTTVRVSANAPEFPAALTARGYRVCSTVPIRFGGELVGVLVLAAMDGASMSRPSEVRLLDAIGDQIAPAIENAKLAREIQEVSVVRERERISREMHDGLGQVLGYVNTQALAVQKLLSRGDVDAALDELRRLDAAARSVYADVRDNILALRESPVEHGLTEVLADYIDSYREMFGIDATLEVAPGSERARLFGGYEIQLIRIVQQALSNVRQHAGATSAHVAFRQEDDAIVVEIRDNGAGFDPAALPAVSRPRFGLQMMRERAQAAGGSFTVESAVGTGTCVTVRMPIRR